ncbi:conserved hypothetical protein [Vibrio chagasii]|nr:conserved hypothetical protein [Vibrio chagasii]
MQGDFSFGNFDQVDHRDNFEPLPGNTYDFRILAPELNPTKNGDGQKVEIPLQVEGGDYDGRKVYARFNVANPNPTAVEIALKQLKQLFMSAGIPATGEIKMSMINGLESRMCRAQIYVKKDKEHGDKNEIRRFVVPEGAGMAQSNMNQQNSYQPQQTASQPQQGNMQPQNNNQMNQNQPNQNQQGNNMPWQQG